ncbi:MAG: prephenate dehydrogenase [Anaerolineae bacterium]|nr:prephenate dehydrogenase [Anaerolineae bacterium]
MLPLSEARITIVGLGLMGGSLAGALRGKCRQVVGVARRSETLEKALALGFIDQGTTSIAEGVQGADVIILATPVRTIIQQIEELAPLLPPGCLLMDLGSTKRDIVAAMEQLPPYVQPLGGHPMCGKEKAGLEVADPELYRGRTFILTPLPRTSPDALALGQAIAEAVGARPLVLEAGRQDYLVATLSHLPYLLACALVATADATTSSDPAAWEIVAGGFRDTSRVAASDVTMMVDILLTNQDEVLKAVRVYQEQLHRLAQLVAAGDEDKLRAALGAIQRERLRMFP